MITKLNWIDITVVALYFVFVIAVALWSMCKKKDNTVSGYFLAGRSMWWFPIGASLFASNIGSEHFIGLAGSGAASGIGVSSFELGKLHPNVRHRESVVCLLLLGWLFLPVYLSANLVTMPEYLHRRFGGTRIQMMCTLLALFLYICSRISVNVYAGSIFIQQVLGWNMYISIAVLIALTAIYTIAGFYTVGGLTGLMEKYPHAVPTTFSDSGIPFLFTNSSNLLNLTGSYPQAIPTTFSDDGISFNITNSSSLLNSTRNKCGLPREDAFHILRDPIYSDLPWPGVLIRSTLASTWYWCADQVIVQRALAAKDIGHARGATLMAGYLKFLPMFFMVLPGMISRVLFPDTVACSDEETCMKVCENPVGCSNIAYPQLILGLAPVGVRGLMIAVMMAAQMSSLTSFFSGSATLFSMDIWRKIRKSATEKELLIVGKVSVVVLVGLSILWVPLIKAAQQGQLFLYGQAVNGYISPPMCSVYLLAVLMPRVNEQGTFWGMTVGLTTGMIRMILDFIYPSPTCGQTEYRPGLVARIHFTYFSCILLVLTAVVTLIISLLTDRPDKKQLRGLTFWTMDPVKSSQNYDVELKHMYKQVSKESKSAVKDEEEENLESSPKTNETGTTGTSEGNCLKIETDEIQNDNSADDITNRKMFISSRIKICLNMNALLLIGLYVLVNIFFR